MKRRDFLKSTAAGAGGFALSQISLSCKSESPEQKPPDYSKKADYDVVVLSATPCGIMAAIGAARQGKSALLLERSAHIGGLPANGLGATDIATRGVTGGLFLEFVNAVKSYYVQKYGADSKQVKDCSDGYHFEPSVAANSIFQYILSGY